MKNTCLPSTRTWISNFRKGTLPLSPFSHMTTAVIDPGCTTGLPGCPGNTATGKQLNDEAL